MKFSIQLCSSWQDFNWHRMMWVWSVSSFWASWYLWKLQLGQWTWKTSSCSHCAVQFIGNIYRPTVLVLYWCHYILQKTSFIMPIGHKTGNVPCCLLWTLEMNALLSFDIWHTRWCLFLLLLYEMSYGVRGFVALMLWVLCCCQMYTVFHKIYGSTLVIIILKKLVQLL